MKTFVSLIIATLILNLMLTLFVATSAQALEGPAWTPPVDQTLIDAVTQAKNRYYQALHKAFEFSPVTPSPATTERTDALSQELNVPAVPGDANAWSKIAFESHRNGNWEIYLARGDGTLQTRLTNHGAADTEPRLNRGATRVAFVSERDGNPEIYSVDANGANLQRLTSYGDTDNTPVWSPDGRRIAFARYVNDNWDLFVMNADGSDQNRLTTHSADDRMPAWSPDGQRLAWVRSASDIDGVLMVMNADGRNQHSISEPLRYLQHPAWSPDSTQLAIDYDYDHDLWNELATMRDNGSNRQIVLDLGGWLTDVWLGSWSPDGRYLIFSTVTYAVFGQQLILDRCSVDIVSAEGGSPTTLPGSGRDMLPDWQTMDNVPPTSNVAPLPAQSPGPFTVRWSGSDTGPAGLSSFDVQVKDGPSGPWGDWRMATTERSASLPGIGGHTYYFRSRARDNALNLEPWPANADTFTTVESLPPATMVQPLPEFSKGQAQVTWTSFDAGGSQVDSYDVEVRDEPAGAWTEWFTGFQNTSFPLPATPGHTMYVRVRGRDRAHNIEPWAGGDGDTSTTFYTWAANSIVRDNRGTPLAGVEVTSNPAAFTTVSGAIEGAYRTYVADPAEVYKVAWVKVGYGDLPATSFPGSEDGTFHAVLPPPDNVVRNWGFESGTLDPGDWRANCVTPPVVANSQGHSGHYAVRLNQTTSPFQPPLNLTNGSPYILYTPQILVDESNVIHVVGGGLDPAPTRYFRREPDGTWSAPTQALASGRLSRFAVDSTGIVHLISVTGYYTRRALDGTWSTPVLISETYGNLAQLQMALEVSGVVHVVWIESNPWGTFYASRNPDGIWSAPRNLSTNGHQVTSPQLALDEDGAVHVVWTDYTQGVILYSHRSSTGEWSAPQNLSPEGGRTALLAVDGHDNLQVAWVSNYVYHAQRSPDGTWTPPHRVSIEPSDVIFPMMAVAEDGTVHLAWREDFGGFYARREPGGAWLPLEPMDLAFRMVVDPLGTVHFILSGDRYQTRTSSGTWSVPQRLFPSLTTTSGWADLAVSGSGVPHFVNEYHDQDAGYNIYFTEPKPVSTDNDCTIAQAVALPPAMSAPTLSFLYRLHGASSGDNWMSAQVDDGIGATTVFSTSAEVADWRHVWFDLTPWAGQGITLSLTLHETAGGAPAVAAYIDEVSIGSGHPDLWIAQPSSPTALPGQQISYEITYGNRGGTLAHDVRISDTLPAELSFVSATPPPDSTSPVLVWNVGDLPADAEPLTIVLTVLVDSSITLLSTIGSEVRIGSISAELESSNNLARSTMFIGHRRWMPLIRRP